jgi:hypothetical protein
MPSMTGVCHLWKEVKKVVVVVKIGYFVGK